MTVTDLRYADFTPALRWFSGKSREQAFWALRILAEALGAGRWPKGASRKVRAALNKQNEARKFAARHDPHDQQHYVPLGAIGAIADNREQSWKATVRGTDVVHAMKFGSFGRARQTLATCEKLVPHTQADIERASLAVAREWAASWVPVADAVAYLDSLRPAAVFTSLGVSPTVTRALLGRGLDPATVRVPPIKGILVEYCEHARIKPCDVCRGAGKVQRRVVYSIDWPTGTVHGALRWVSTRAKHEQCHACGHAIKNVLNWVPLLIDKEVFEKGIGFKQTPHSMWVGGDCAHNLFGIKKDGDAEWQSAEGR